MGKKEVFRAQNARVDRDGISCCLTFSLLEGEVLGFHVPRAQDGASVIMDVVHGRLPLRSGGLFYYETRRGEAPPAEGWPSIASIRTESSLSGELSVQDNLFLLRKRHSRSQLYSGKMIRGETLRQIKRFDMDIRPEQQVNTLSRIQRYMLEIIKAYLHNTDIIIIDQFFWELSLEELRPLEKLLNVLKSEGISFIMTSDKMTRLRLCCDRIGFFDGVRIVDILENTPENSAVISATCDSIVKSFSQHRWLVQVPGRKQTAPIETEDWALRSLGLLRGERVAIYDPSAILYRRLMRSREEGTIAFEDTLPSRTRRAHAFFADFGNSERTFHMLPVMDHLLLGRKFGWSALVPIRGRLKNLLRQEFEDRFQEEGMLDVEDSALLSSSQRMKLYLYRISLRNPEVLIAWNFPKADPELKAIIDREADAVIEEERTVCYLTMDIYDNTMDADRYMLVTAQGMESYRTYEQMVREGDALGKM